MSKVVKITIDDKEVHVPEGMGLVEAAAEAGVEIPVFCHHSKLDPVGVCRMCLVEVEGQRKPVTACTMRSTEGMVVRTETPHIAHLRKGVLEFLLLNHPLDCPVCDKGGECPLQDHTFKYGPTTSRLQVPKMQKRKAVDMGNFIVLDEERCILCRRCVRFDGEIALEGNLVVGERAHEAMITTTDGMPYNSYFSGNTIELCPVGALTSKNYRFRSRPWDLSSAPSICTGCSVGCNVELDFRLGELVRLRARENTEVDAGWLCDRGRFNYRYIHSDERITQPLMRRGNEFVAVSWSEALLEIANRLRTIRRDKGAEQIGFIGGGRLTNEEAYALQKLARSVVGTPNIDHRVGTQQVASWNEWSGRIADIDDADVIVNVDVLAQERIPVVDLRIRRAAQRNGAKLFNIGAAVSPYNVPHTDILVAPGQTKTTLRQVQDAVSGSETKTLSADTQAFVEALQQGDKVVVIWGGDDVNVGHALHDLLTAWTKTGADKKAHVLIPGEQTNSRGAEAMGVLPDMGPGFEPLSGEAAGMNTSAMLQAAADDQLQALYIAGANLVGTYPQTALVRKALKKASFVVVQDLFMTATAQLADIVLPAAEFPAKTGTYMNLEGRVQAVEQAMAEREDTRTDGDIFRAVAGALGGQLVASEQEFRWEVQHVLDGLTEDGFGKGRALPAGAAVSETAENEERIGIQDGVGTLRLVSVERLYSGGGTAAFDPGFRHVQPSLEAILHADDAARLAVSEDDKVSLTLGDVTMTCNVRISEDVLPGTVQVPKGVVDSPVGLLQTDDSFPLVTVRKRVLEVVG